MAEPSAGMRILAVVPLGRRLEIARQLAPLGADVIFLKPSDEFAHLVGQGGVFHVAILPAAMPDTEWWDLWGMLALLDRRPAILVYAREATFRLWSGVLEAGGFDLIVEPFTDCQLQQAVLRAARDFEERPARGASPT